MKCFYKLQDRTRMLIHLKMKTRPNLKPKPKMWVTLPLFICVRQTPVVRVTPLVSLIDLGLYKSIDSRIVKERTDLFLKRVFKK